MDLVWERQPINSTALSKLCQERLGWKKSTTFNLIRKLGERGVLKNENATVTALVGAGGGAAPRERGGGGEVLRRLPARLRGRLPERQDPLPPGGGGAAPPHRRKRGPPWRELLMTVGRMSITAALTVLAVLALRWALLRLKAPAFVRLLLWAVVLFRMVCPVSFASPWGGGGPAGAGRARPSDPGGGARPGGDSGPARRHGRRARRLPGGARAGGCDGERHAPWSPSPSRRPPSRP